MVSKPLLWALVASSSVAISTMAQTPSEVGRSYEIRRSYETTSQRGDEGSGSSSGYDTIVERVVAERDGGLELEFDYPTDTSKERRARDWQFPVRVFRSAEGAFTLVNRPKVEKRVDDWLNKAKIDRRACGSWYFTWNAFKVECDPLSVRQTVSGFDIRSTGVRSEQLYSVNGVTQPAPLRQVSSVSGEARFIADLIIDPQSFRREAAESDVVVAQLTGKTLAISDAMESRAKEKVSGTVKVQLDLGGMPTQVVRRTKVTEIQIDPLQGPVETRTSKEVIERKPLG